MDFKRTHGADGIEFETETGTGLTRRSVLGAAGVTLGALVLPVGSAAALPGKFSLATECEVIAHVTNETGQRVRFKAIPVGSTTPVVNEVIPPMPAGSEGVDFEVPPGSYRVRARAGGQNLTIYDGETEAELGRRIEIAQCPTEVRVRNRGCERIEFRNRSLEFSANVRVKEGSTTVDRFTLAADERVRTAFPAGIYEVIVTSSNPAGSSVNGNSRGSRGFDRVSIPSC